MSDRDEEFAEFFSAQWSPITRTAYGVCGDQQLAEDIGQVAFAKAYAAWGRVSKADDPVAYVRRIAVNAAISQGRRASSRRESTVAETPDRPVVGEADRLVVHEQVWAAVRSLPPRQRAVVVLRYYEDLSEQQIADALGCRPGTVKSQASAALRTLEHQLQDGAVGERGARR